MSKRKIGIMAAVLVLLMVGVVWALRGRGPDPQVEKLKGMLGDGRPQPGQFDQLREELRKLTPEQRRQVGEEMGRRRDKEIADFFKLPPDKQRAELDKRIQEMEKWRKEREQHRPQAGQGQNPGAQGPGGMGPGGTGQGPGQGPGGNAGGGGAGRGRNMNPTAQSARANQRLDNSSPAQRAQRLAYGAALQQRRIQLGLPASPFGGRGFGGR